MGRTEELKVIITAETDLTADVLDAKIGIEELTDAVQELDSEEIELEVEIDAEESLDTLDDYESKIKDAGNATDDLDDSLAAGLNPSLGSFSKLLKGAVAPELLALAAVVLAVKAGFEALSFVVTNSAEASKEWEEIQTMFADFGKEVAEVFGPIVIEMLQALKIVMMAFFDAARPAMEELQEAFELLAATMEDPAMQEALRELAVALTDLMLSVTIEEMKLLSDLIKEFADIWRLVGPTVINVITGIVHIMATLTNAIAKAIELFREFLNLAGSASGTTVPGAQHGIENFAGGLLRVGESGPESVILPRGSSVIPDGGMLARGGGGGMSATFYGPVTIQADSRSTAFGLLSELVAGGMRTAP